jgi:hypothetical protein
LLVALPSQGQQTFVAGFKFGAMFAPTHRAVADELVRVPARRHDQDDQLHARGLGG